MKKVLICMVAGLSFFHFSAYATIIRVPQDQPTIQVGINSSVNGDTVLVGPGTYFVNLNFNGKNIVLRSEFGPEVTILRPSATGQTIVTWQNGEETTSVLNGFTVSGAKAPFGGILAYDASPRIKKCIIHSDTGTYLPNYTVGGICLIGRSHSVVESCIVYNNVAINGIGGGIGCFQVRGVRISYNLLWGNSAKNLGGGITIFEAPIDTTIYVFNNTVVSNIGGFQGGGGLVVYQPGGDDTVKVFNNIFSQNVGIGLSKQGSGAELNSMYNDFDGNTVASDSGVSFDSANVTGNPLFVGGFPFDYGLRLNSPCIDGGDPNSAVPPGGGLRVDIGAYEFEGLKFNLLHPANNSLILDRKPQLFWESLRDTGISIAATYKVFLSTNQIFVPADSSPMLADTTWIVPSSLHYFQIYFWKVVAYSASGDTVFNNNRFSTFRIDAPPTIPELIEPEIASEVGANSYLIWKKSVDGDAGDTLFYSLQVDDEQNFNNPEISVSRLSENGSSRAGRFNISRSATNTNLIGYQLNTLTGFGNLKDDTAYYWRIKSEDNHGADSGWTDGPNYFVFNSINSPPKQVAAGFSPSNEQIVIDLTPEISWFPASDPDPNDNQGTLHYNLQLDDDGEFTIDKKFEYVTAPGLTSLFVPDSLTDNAHWYYRIKTVDDEGATSSYSAIQDFFTNSRNEPPANFALTYPPNSGKIVVKAPVLDWEDAIDPDPSDTVTYSLTLSADSQFLFAFTQIGLTASSFSVPSGVLSRGGQYYWKVKAFDTRDSATFSNEIFRFRLLYLGDLNGDGILSPADIVLLLNHVFLGIAVDPPEVADMNCDGNATSADIVLGLNAVFLGQTPPCDP